MAFALSEPCCGSDAFSLEAEAGRRGGSWVINGTKLWITSDIYADAFLVAARTGPPEEKTQWMKECVETTPVTVMGVRGTCTAEVVPRLRSRRGGHVAFGQAARGELGS
jgi:alkylation response protein AidB-like acyl-CoA dehydrogenase